MDTRTGRIVSLAEAAAMRIEDRAFMRPMEVAPTPTQARTGRVGRNDKCPCGSGRKFKACCLCKP